MTFRADIDAARAKLAELEHTLAERDRELAALDAQLAKHDEAIAAAMPQERDRVRLRQLDAAIAQTRQETAQLRVMLASAPALSPRAQGERVGKWLGAIVLAAFIFALFAIYRGWMHV